LNAPAVDNLKDRVCQIWGHNFAQNLVELENVQNTEVKIYGLISNHNFWRYGRELIHFFVNIF
jgi:DNA mismatch repair ATPase MutL